MKESVKKQDAKQWMTRTWVVILEEVEGVATVRADLDGNSGTSSTVAARDNVRVAGLDSNLSELGALCRLVVVGGCERCLASQFGEDKTTAAGDSV